MADSSGLAMSFTRYAASVPAGSPGRIWLGPLRQKHKTEVHTRAEWEALADVCKARPVTYENLRRPAEPGHRR